MGLLTPLMVKQEFTANDLTLEAKAGKSLLIRDIRIVTPTGNHATIKIGKTTVGYFRTAGNLGNHLGMGFGSSIITAAADVMPHVAYETILALLMRKGIFVGYPVGEGETFVISGVKAAGCLQQVLYSEYDAGDMLPTMPNGSESAEYLLFNYGRTDDDIILTADNLYDRVQSPAEFPDFPFGKDVPAKTEIDLIGILASDIISYASAADCVYSTYIKLIRQRKMLFDDDKNGLIMYGDLAGAVVADSIATGISMLGNYSDTDMRPPFLFDPVLTFVGGEELGVFLSTIVGATQSTTKLPEEDTEICLIERIRKVA